MNAETIARIARKQLKTLGENSNGHAYQVNLKPKHDGSAHLEDLANGKYRFVYTERGQEYNARVTDNSQDILYWIYQDATFEIACKWEVKNRVPDNDSRRLIFDKQLELLRMIGEEYALRREKEIEAVLSAHPFTNRNVP